MYHPFSVAETIKTSWGVLKGNFAILAIYSVISLVVIGFTEFVNSFMLLDDSIGYQLLVLFIQMLVQSYLALSFYKLILTLMDKAYYEFEFREIWPSFAMAFRFIIIGLSYSILIATFWFINLLLEKQPIIQNIARVLEGIAIGYLLIRSIFCVCFVVDEDSHAYEALLQSFLITKDNFFKTLSVVLIILGFMVATLLIILTFIGLFEPDEDSYILRLAFYLWFVIAFPTVQVLVMVTYRKLVYAHQDIDDGIAETD